MFREPAIIGDLKIVWSMIESESSQKWCSNVEQSERKCSIASPGVAFTVRYAGLAIIRTNPFEVIGQVDQPNFRLAPNQSWADW